MRKLERGFNSLNVLLSFDNVSDYAKLSMGLNDQKLNMFMKDDVDIILNDK